MTRHIFACFISRPALGAMVAFGLMAAPVPGLAPVGPAFAQTQRLQLVPPNPVGRPAQITSTPLAPGATPAPDPFNPEPIPLDGNGAPLVLDLSLDGDGSNPLVLSPLEPTFEPIAPDREAAGVPVQFSAFLNEGGPALQRDLSWNVYALADRNVDQDDLVLSSQGGPLDDTLPPGSYLVHVAYGMATLARPLTVGTLGLTEAFNLNAGGMSLRGAIAPDRFLPDAAVRFEIFPETVDNLETARPIAADVAERTVLVVPAGRYTVVSRYGDVNAVVRAQIDVEPGQLTEAVMFHNAARVILKLVNEPNGEALPNTAWSVLNPGGDIIQEFVGAFPSMVLSEGEYTIIARHDGQVFSREFDVVAGVDREEELVAQ